MYILYDEFYSDENLNFSGFIPVLFNTDNNATISEIMRGLQQTNNEEPMCLHGLLYKTDNNRTIIKSEIAPIEPIYSYDIYRIYKRFSLGESINFSSTEFF